MAGGLYDDVIDPIGVRWVPVVRGLHIDYSGSLQRPTEFYEGLRNAKPVG